MAGRRRPERRYRFAMELHEVLARRRMVRRFADEAVPRTRLDPVLAAALRAPSAGFAQGVDLLVLESPARRAAFWEAASEPGWRAGGPRAADLLVAPVIVVPIADPDAYLERYGAPDKATSSLAGLDATSWPMPYWLVDAAFATMLVLLAATDAGLGALFFRLHRGEAGVLDALGVPVGRRTIGALALGVPAPGDPPTSPAHRRRRAFAEVVHRERW